MAERKRLYQDVLKQMLADIDSGGFPAGGRLPPERELAERFGVSRPTIREAVIALEALGRVRVKTGSGIYVETGGMALGGSLKDMTAYELTESRALIEGEAAALAAALITPAELEALAQTLEDMARETDEGDLASGDADRDFHQIIAKATRNSMIVQIVDHLWHVRNNAPQVYLAYKSICEMDGKRRVEEHEEIYQALLHNNAEAARTAMHHHFSRILNKLIQVAEAEKMEEARRQSEEVRSRFSMIQKQAVQ